MHTWQIHPPPRAVTSGGMLGAIGVDSQIRLQRLGLKLGAGLSGLSLEIGVRGSPHMGDYILMKILEVYYCGLPWWWSQGRPKVGRQPSWLASPPHPCLLGCQVANLVAPFLQGSQGSCRLEASGHLGRLLLS